MITNQKKSKKKFQIRTYPKIISEPNRPLPEIHMYIITLPAQYTPRQFLSKTIFIFIYIYKLYAQLTKKAMRTLSCFSPKYVVPKYLLCHVLSHIQSYILKYIQTHIVHHCRAAIEPTSQPVFRSSSSYSSGSSSIYELLSKRLLDNYR